MRQPPRPAGEGVLTPRMWRGIFFVGIIMAAGPLFIVDAALPGHDAVVLDESVQIAKEFSTDDSPAFVNGLLGRLKELKPSLRR